jgi:hypothetical protein
MVGHGVLFLEDLLFFMGQESQQDRCKSGEYHLKEGKQSKSKMKADGTLVVVNS